MNNNPDGIDNKTQEGDENRERAILVGVSFSSNQYEGSSKESMRELSGLLETANGQKVGEMLQNRPVPESATFIGTGKAQEIADLVKSQEADLVIFDNELSPTQIRNLESYAGVRVIDRSQLILHIFAMRAQTKEGKLQTELAQYRYMLPRLTSSYEQLSRLGGGIGTRGPGETKLETDRRHIKNRILFIEKELKEAVRTRTLQRNRREKGVLPIISLIGYTNAGKSTLFNLLTRENTLVENKLFATLDTTTRKAVLEEEITVLVTDTVGFIRHLPHHLIEAFKSTLEELRYADILLHVVDVSNPDWQAQMAVVQGLIEELKASHIPQITVFNKCDQCDDLALAKKDADSCFISAKTGANVDAMIHIIVQKLNEGKRIITLHLPYAEGKVLDHIHEDGEVLQLSYEAEYIKICLRCNQEMAGRLGNFIAEEI